MIVDGPMRLWGCDDIHILVDDAPPPTPGDDVERRWRELCDENPRHFDGPILSVDSFDAETGVVKAHVDSYKRLAAQPQVSSGVTLLAATAALVADDESGRTCVLMIKRHEQTRLYGGLWEFGPAGGIDPTGSTRLGLAEVVSLLERELTEEAGLTDRFLDSRVACVYIDDESSSLDVVVRACLGRTVEALTASASETHWDSAATSWTPVSSLSTFVSEKPCIPRLDVVARAIGLAAD